MTQATRERLAGAVLAAALAACVIYAVDRTVAAVRSPIDPRTVVATVRIEYFWRAGVSAFVGSLVGAGWFAWARPGWAAALGRAVLPVAAACATLSALWP